MYSRHHNFFWEPYMILEVIAALENWWKLGILHNSKHAQIPVVWDAAFGTDCVMENA